jgi:hypothetical protein
MLSALFGDPPVFLGCEHRLPQERSERTVVLFVPGSAFTRLSGRLIELIPQLLGHGAEFGDDLLLARQIADALNGADCRLLPPIRPVRLASMLLAIV